MFYNGKIATFSKPSYGEYKTPMTIGAGPLVQKQYFGLDSGSGSFGWPTQKMHFPSQIPFKTNSCTNHCIVFKQCYIQALFRSP